MKVLNDSRINPCELDIVRQYLSTYPVRVGDLCNHLGIKITKSPLNPRISGLIKPSVESDSGFEIKINKYDLPERQRFTVAHEIAHYLLHRNDIGSGVVDNILYRSVLTSKKETEANALAAEIVMPSGAVRHELNKLGGKPNDEIAEVLAQIFKVSTPAMKIRLGLS
jgi:Zn-dependent peptidase ImmA (M78 family)